MKQEIDFKCVGESMDEIPEAVIAATGVILPYAHQNRNQMALLARALKNYHSDTICRIPFCVTVEAEAFGGDIKLGNEKIGPRVNGYIFNKIEDLQCIEKIDLTRGRINEVLGAVEILRDANEVVALNVTGPFTIISALIEPIIFYKALRQNDNRITEFIQIVEDSTVEYMLEGIKRGVDIISYADPAGDIDIVGPHLYKVIVGKTTCSVLHRIEPYLNNTIIHLCGKLSKGLEKTGFVESTALVISEDIKYGDAIIKLKDYAKSIKFIGNACIKKTSFKMKQQVLWQITLK